MVNKVWVLTLGPKYVLALMRKPDNCMSWPWEIETPARLPGGLISLSLSLFFKIIAQFCPMEGLFYTPFLHMM